MIKRKESLRYAQTLGFFTFYAKQKRWRRTA